MNTYKDAIYNQVPQTVKDTELTHICQSKQ